MRHKLKTDPRSLCCHVSHRKSCEGKKPKQGKRIKHVTENLPHLSLEETPWGGFVCLQETSSWFSNREDNWCQHVGLQDMTFFFASLCLYITNNDDSLLMKTYDMPRSVLDAQTVIFNFYSGPIRKVFLLASLFRSWCWEFREVKYISQVQVN